MIKLSATNFNQLKRELKALEGKAIFKLTRINSLRDGEFLRILHKVKTNDIVFWDGEQLTHLNIESAKDIEFIENGFRIRNVTLELLEIK
jgi:hypothetical protein